MTSWLNRIILAALLFPAMGCGYLYPTCTVHRNKLHETQPLSTIERQPRNGAVYVIAHRGAHEDIPENTLAAYRRAIELGCDFVEIDIRTTKDGRFVSVHNETVDAYTSDATGKVSGFTLAELKAMDIGSRVDPKWKDERIPTLEEILTLCRGKIGIYLDLKAAPVQQVANLVRAHGMERDVIWYAPWNTLQALEAMCPTCIPMPDPGPERNLADLFRTFDPVVVAATWNNLSPSFVERCHRSGAMVFVDESDPSCWSDALAWEVDGIQTDHPAALTAFLRNRDRAARNRPPLEMRAAFQTTSYSAE